MLTHDVRRSAIEYYMYEETFWVLAPDKSCGQKTTYFPRFCNLMATLRANISGEERDMDNREMAWKLTKRPLHCS